LPLIFFKRTRAIACAVTCHYDRLWPHLYFDARRLLAGVYRFDRRWTGRIDWRLQAQENSVSPVLMS